MAVVLGEAEVYAHSGGQHEWDSAAPVAVARAAGLHASRLDGTLLVYNRPDPYLPDLLRDRGREGQIWSQTISAPSPSLRSSIGSCLSTCPMRPL